MRSYNFSEVNQVSNYNNFDSLENNNLTEFCFAGRSNVGKSSIINSLLNKKKIATTSNRPGHTKKIFFYTISNSFIIVDLPGYGFANLSKRKTKEISQLLFLYLTKRQSLRKIFILVDSRHGIKESDEYFINFLLDYSLDYQIIFTKIDKISPNKQRILLNNFKNNYKEFDNKVIFTSSKTKSGIKEIRKKIIASLNS